MPSINCCDSARSSLRVLNMMVHLTCVEVRSERGCTGCPRVKKLTSLSTGLAESLQRPPCRGHVMCDSLALGCCHCQNAPQPHQLQPCKDPQHRPNPHSRNSTSAPFFFLGHFSIWRTGHLKKHYVYINPPCPAAPVKTVVFTKRFMVLERCGGCGAGAANEFPQHCTLCTTRPGFLCGDNGAQFAFGKRPLCIHNLFVDYRTAC